MKKLNSAVGVMLPGTAKAPPITTTRASRPRSAGSARSAVATFVSGPIAMIVRPSDSRAARRMTSTAPGSGNGRLATGMMRSYASRSASHRSGSSLRPLRGLSAPAASGMSLRPSNSSRCGAFA
jgi:hypothetical protein